MKSLTRRLIAQFILLLGLVLWLTPLSVECANNPTVSISNPPSQDIAKLKSLCNNINQNIWDAGVFTAGVGQTSNIKFFIYSSTSTTTLVNIEINMIEYKKLGQSGKQTVMQVALDTIYNSNVSRTNRNKLYNDICDLDSSTSSLVRQLSTDVTADFAGAYSTFKPFSGVVGWILGIISLGMFLLIGLTLVFDISYINLPMLQLALNKEPGKKPNLISIEAFNAVKEAEASVGTGHLTSSMGSYLKSKTKQLIAVFICLLYLVSGQLYNIIAQVMDYFQGFIG